MPLEFLAFRLPPKINPLVIHSARPELVAQTTLAQRLSDIFERFGKEIPTNQTDPITVIATWRKVLNLQNESDLKLMGHIGTITAGMSKLQRQIEASQRFPPSYRSAANSAILTLSPLLAFERMMAPAKDLRSHCIESTYGTLGMIGLALSAEFSEPRLEPADADEISATFREIKDLIDGANLPLDLRFDLITQIDQMLIWLSDLDLVSSRELYEKLGSTAFTAALIKGGARDEAENEKRGKIFECIIGVASRVAQIIKTGDELVGGVDKISHDFHHLLTGPPLS